MSLKSWWRWIREWLRQRAPLHIDSAAPDDADTLAAIHAACFAHDWNAEEIAALLRDGNVIGLVARRTGLFGRRRAIGFLLLRTAADEAEVLTIAVDPRRRRLGCGRKLLEAGLRRLYRDRIDALFLEVEAGNQPALALYRRLGFTQVGERRGYYGHSDGTSSAALVMRVELVRSKRR
ncbi:MAG: GNAT family N-acetyltransferase [Ancalomicrobiaceae bacterium]|nr:GNAT family N-acetyltransferase [Ancalomicrobiaceae bacterium]